MLQPGGQGFHVQTRVCAQDSIPRLSKLVCCWLPARVQAEAQCLEPCTGCSLVGRLCVTGHRKLLLSQLCYSRPKKLHCPSVCCNVHAGSCEQTPRWQLRTGTAFHFRGTRCWQ